MNLHKMRPLFTILLSALPALAVFRDEVGDVDFHHALVGLPQQHTTFFHRPRRDDKASLLYTLSDLGILGAVNPSTGAVLWRQHAASGRNIWSAEFPGHVRDLEVMEMAVSGDGRKDLLALSCDDESGRHATTLRRLHGTEGTVVWDFHDDSKDMPLQVSNNVDKVFVVSLHGSPGAYGLKVTALDPPTGRRLDEILISAGKGDIASEKDVMFVGANSAMPILAWVDGDRNTLMVNVLGTKAKHEYPLVAGTQTVDIHAPHLVQSDPHFLVHMRTRGANAAAVFHIDLKTSAVSKAYDLPLLAGTGAVATSSIGANVYFTRVTQNELILVASTSHGVLGRWPFKPAANIGVDKIVDVSHAVAEVVKKSGDNYAVRAAALTVDEDWVLAHNGELGWVRPEGLSGAVAGAWAEIPESESLAKTLEAEAHSNPIEAYLHRARRHAADLEHLPDWLANLPRRIISSVFGTEAPASGALMRDSFGFNKIIVLATRRGRVYGLNAGNRGQVLWNRKVFSGSSAVGWEIKGLHVDDSKGTVAIRASDGEFVALKTDSGEVVESELAGLTPEVQSTALVDSASGPWLLPIPKGGELGPLPAELAPKQTVVIQVGDELRGVKYFPVGDAKTSEPVVTWTFRPAPGQTIVEMTTRPPHDPVASIGRVLGDRTVLYKYLNKNTLLVAAAGAEDSTLTTYLLDTVSGELLSSATYAGVDAARPVTCAMSENFFACSFFGDYALQEDPSQAVKGHLVAVTDLYESEFANDRGALGDPAPGAPANFSPVAPLEDPTTATAVLLPHVVSQTWVLASGPVAALAVTTTRQGVSSRELLAYLPESRQLAALHRAVLEPRRPVGRDPTAHEAEEGLMRYGPAVEVDPKLVVSHELDLLLPSAGAGAGRRRSSRQTIVTAPALVESTCLVLAFGVDVYVTRVAPSFVFDILGKGFGKVSLVGTVLALSAGVAALGPMVRKKQINLRWSAPA
ncbi:hypothetical protein MAPG_02023 [Magnaporthiopsis poae ATCC 64411]|uniref:ER membrane protein complex subunit 1 n=1 Tax=Magnaporthiopsis poae (strain ATCC 64411 / 73-15) TaxID=644358 RepID=A0A0C4DQ85_MAGP6|nr:hypothetical protein MAPG_02023 [Magnaporthiopsis poae ATCC 64411]